MRLAARPSAAIAAGAVRTDDIGSRSPAIVLAYAYSGATRIADLLSGSPCLACTSGTGLLPLCYQAAETWRRIDNRDGPLSPLAISSIRALADSMITVMLTAAGKARWCEISFSPPIAAQTVLRLYPGTKFLCLHRSCADVIRVGVKANPWGLAGNGLDQFTLAYPGNSAAALAAYWAESTGQLLRFEQANPAACVQVSYENLAARPDQAAQEIFEFLDLPWDSASALGHVETEPAREDCTSMADIEMPADLLPGPLRDRVNDLQVRLGYPPFI